MKFQQTHAFLKAYVYKVIVKKLKDVMEHAIEEIFSEGFALSQDSNLHLCRESIISVTYTIASSFHFS